MRTAVRIPLVLSVVLMVLNGCGSPRHAVTPTSSSLNAGYINLVFVVSEYLSHNDVMGIYALEPMTHLQTADLFPDMADPETIQQFAMLNTETLQFNPVGSALYTANSFRKKEKL